MADVLDLLCRAYQAEFEQFSLGRGQESPFRYLSQAQYQGLVWQLLEQYGLFSGTPKDRYSDGRLDEILMEALSQERVLLWRLLFGRHPAMTTAALVRRTWASRAMIW